MIVYTGDNLVRNAQVAVKDSSVPEIELSAERKDTSRAIIRIRDNGEGIPAENLEQIFIPFF